MPRPTRAVLTFHHAPLDGHSPRLLIDENKERLGEGDMDDDDTQTYLVVLNDEEQYSIWPADRDMPPGWRGDGFSGLEADCLAHIGEVWTDMRPLSLRRAMEQAAGS